MSNRLQAAIAFYADYPRSSPQDYLRLERIRALLAELGHPERRLSGVQVIGTNGKGSVTAMLESALRASGLRTGMLTGPHLIRYAEAIRINGHTPGDKAFLEILKNVAPAAGRVEQRLGDRPSYFEILVASAAQAFVRARCDVIVVEAGLGGRRDATTALELPFKVITNITLDHPKNLGRTISAITKEKAGALRRGDVVVTGATGRALSVLRLAAAAKRARIIVAGEPPASAQIRVDWQGTELRLPNETLRTSLIGTHQADNLQIAWATLNVLESSGISVDAPKVLNGLRHVDWPGRFTVINSAPRIIVDGAHNPAGIRALISTLDHLCVPKRGLTLLFAAKRSKPPAKELPLLTRRVSTLIFPVMDPEKFWTPRELQKWAPTGHATADPASALRAAHRASGRRGTILVCGSLVLVGAVLAFRTPIRYHRKTTGGY